jgi:acyl carrier protein
MTNEEKYTAAFVEALGIDASKLTDDLAYSTIPEWDSVAHMQLISELEDQFDIMMETEDVLDLSSFGKGKEILLKYDVAV